MTRFAQITAALTLAFAAIVAPAPNGSAQTEGEQLDGPPAQQAGFLEGLIQDALGGEGREVRVIGLSGALSSQASIDQVVISDDDGVWLRVSDIELNWRRVALLRRRLQIEQLSIGEIDLLRTPAPQPGEPPALAADEEAQPFSLPQLPVSVNVDDLTIESFQLGEPVAGYEAALSLNGTAQLADGAGQVDLTVQRIDDQSGTYSLTAGYNNDNRNLLIDLGVDEEAGGLITTLAGIPGAPPLAATIQGDAPLSDFTADLALQTDGVDRLSGTVGIADATESDGERVITADVSGDVAPLFLPDYRTFFGNEVALALRARQGGAAGLDIDELNLTTRALRLSGTLDLNESYLPVSADLTGQVATENGAPVLLPVGPNLLLDSADLTLRYGEEGTDTFLLDLTADGVMGADGLLIDRMSLRADGSVDKASESEINSVTADLTTQVNGFATPDRALWEAIGQSFELTGDIDWENGGALTVSGLEAVAETLRLVGQATVTGLQEGAPSVQADVQAQVAELSNFSRLAGQDLAGALNADVTGQYDTVSGAFNVDLDGTATGLEIGAAQTNNLLSGDVALALQAARTAEGISVDTLSVAGERVQIEGNAAIGPDGVPRNVNLTGRVGDPDGAPVVLPAPGPETTLQSADIDIQYDAANDDAFSARILANAFNRAGVAELAEARINADGTLERSDDGIAALEATLDGALSGLALADPALSEAIGGSVQLSGQSSYDAEAGTAQITDLTLTSGETQVTGQANATGLADAATSVEATIDLSTGPLARFAELAGLPLSGQANLAGNASYDTGNGFFTVDLDGTTTDLAIGQDSADALLAGEVALAVQASRDADGISVPQISIDGQRITLTGNAQIGPDNLPQLVDLSGQIGDPQGDSVVLPIPGPATRLQSADLTASYDANQDGAFTLDMQVNDLDREGLAAMDLATITADGQLNLADNRITGATADVTAALDGLSSPDEALNRAIAQGAQFSGQIAWDADDARLEVTDLDLTSGELSLAGQALVTELGEPEMAVDAQIDAATGPLQRFAALAGIPMTGRAQLQGEAQFAMDTGFFTVDLDGTTRDLSIGQSSADALLAGVVDLSVEANRDDDSITVSDLTIDGEQINLDGSALIGPDFWPREVDLAGRIGSDGAAPVVLPIPGPATRLQSAEIAANYDAAQGDGFTFEMRARDLVRQGVAAMAEADITADGTLSRSNGALQGATAQVAAALSGLSADDPGLNAAIAPGADLTATIDWQAQANRLAVREIDLTSGALSLTGQALIRALGQPDMVIETEIDAQTGPLSRFAAIAGQDLTGSLTADGSASFAPESGFFDIDLTAQGSGLGIGIPTVDRLIDGTSNLRVVAARTARGLNVDTARLQTNDIQVTADGSMQGGTTRVTLDGRLNNLAVIAPDFPGAVTLQATATQTGQTWRAQGNVNGPGGSSARFNGVVLGPNGRMDLSTTGQIPLGLANRVIEPRAVSGTAQFDLRIAGQPSLSALSGTVNINDGRVSDPGTGLALENIDVGVNIANQTAQVNANAALTSGGTISIQGPVALTGDFNGDLTATLNALQLRDPSLYETTLNGRITMSGPLAGGAVIAGQIDVGSTEIRVPTGFGGPGAVPDITHVGESDLSFETRRRANLIQDDSGDGGGGGGPVYPLDITISAPNQIFIRGRGLDAELGGQIVITGTTANPIPTGSLELIRGRLSILTQRLTFDEAQILLQGDFQPTIRMVASANTPDARVAIVIEGPLRQPDISFRSDPELPEDEILALLFFNKPVSELTPLEVAQLAAAINRLRGGGPGFFGAVRENLGVDDLSFTTDEDGNTALSAGKYLSERVYTDVSVGQDGTSEIQLNYEIRQGFSVRGSFDTEGDTGVGLVYEFDY